MADALSAVVIAAERRVSGDWLSVVAERIDVLDLVKRLMARAICWASCTYLAREAGSRMETGLSPACSLVGDTGFEPANQPRGHMRTIVAKRAPDLQV